jgi:hypothetical protein
MAKLVWRVKLVTELQAGETTEVEVARIERDQQAGLSDLASRQTTLSPRWRNACTSHGVIGPVSIPMLASPPACPRTARSIGSGSDRH